MRSGGSASIARKRLPTDQSHGPRAPNYFPAVYRRRYYPEKKGDLTTIWEYHTGASLAVLRRQVGSWAAKHHVPDAETVTLLVDELVTNALVHGGATTILVRVETEAESVRLTVEDPSSTPPSLTKAELGLDEGGRGLLLVDKLSSQWGWSPLPHGKCVWCVIGPVPPNHRPAGPSATDAA